MAGLFDLDIGGLFKAGGQIIDDLHTSDEERQALALKDKKIDAGLQTGQMEINKTEAGHRSIFVAGWRPFIGWVGGFALGYKFLFHPLLIWIWCICQANELIPAGVKMPPGINAQELYPIIMGMLGLGTMRTVEGIQGKKTNALQAGPKKKAPGFKWPWSKQ